MFRKLRKTTRLAMASFALFGGLVFGATYQLQSVAAAPVDVLPACDNGSRVCAGTDKNSLAGLITNVVNLLLFVAGVIAVIMIIIGGIRYSTSAGDAGQTKSARDTIVYAIAGLVVAIMSFAIVNLVLSKL